MMWGSDRAQHVRPTLVVGSCRTVGPVAELAMPGSESYAGVIVTHEDIVAGLRKLGLGAGAGIMVHSSLRRFGHVAGGALTIIAALKEVLTPTGTLAMPSFNHGAPFEPGGLGYYSPVETPTTDGTVPDAFWRLPDVSRSLNPTHAFAAWGRNARRYTAYHHRTLTMGAESPLGLIWQEDGYALFLGTDYRTNTFHHVVETVLESPCLGHRTEEYSVILPDGRRVPGRTWGWREAACPFNDENRYADEMTPYHRQVQVGQSTLTLVRLQDCFAVVARILRQGKAGFPPCRGCPIRPRRVPESVPTDWDREHGRLRPDSTAWSY